MERVLGFVLALLFVAGVSSQRAQRCLKGSCYPATGDLLIGRENSLYASSTCGLEEASRYCIVSHLEDVKKCFYCDSRQPFVQGLAERSHRIENIVSSFRTRRRRWWQAENGVKNAYIQLNLEAEFHFTHLIMTFKTFRPAAMLVERSYDFGRTWKVYRYFAYDCEKSFPGISTRPVRKLNDVICVSRYSEVAPSSGGEVIFRVLPPQIGIDDPYSQAVQDLLKLTNLRVNFTDLHTLGDNLLDNRPEIKEKYYFALYDMTVRGSCACYGHASRCLPLSGFDSNVDPNLRPVFGRCECTHNTMGLNCEMCENFYHDQPWKPARGKTTNACKKCNCNNHATVCHFDAAVYEATAKVSGGVCDDCEHNTMGRNCEQCMSYFFQDPNRDIRDPNVCQPCDCDPWGSLRKALCDRRNDEVNGLVAGRCHCKRFVDGRRCDTCTNGYWNLDDSNPDGCEACSCNLLGTIGNFGCDKASGLCRCKRYVVGRSCDQCYFGYWGLSAEQSGCRACDCDIGGALSEECDQQSGQCQCRQNIIGLKCKKVQPGFFYASLDHNLYEAEFARGLGNARLYIREPYPDSPSSWTGRGFMKIMEGDSIEFTIDHIPLSMNYNLVLRYDPRMPEPWEDVRVTVVRGSRVDSEGACANSIPQDDFKATTIQPGSRYTIVSPQSCLEKGETYTIRVDFNRYRSDLITPEATLLIDSLLVVPHTESIPIFQGPREPEYMLREFIRYRCRDMMMPTVQQQLPDLCKKHVFSISAVLHDMALPCECHPIGSVNADCEEFAGQCECRPNVVGRRCDQCAPGTYGFGPQGCSPCNCNAVGSRDNFCDVQNGQCLCAPNTYGRMCDECQRGFWGFPNCRKCECNGHAEICDNQSGRCIDCTNFTIGSFCESCLDGYYGDPRDRIQIPCQPCLCPGGPGSAVQHADTCLLDPRDKRVICNCQPNYRGIHCDECAENYYGDPINPGGSCDSCMCNNNINLDAPGNCDADSGECLLCLYDTEGFSCEKCAPGFFGDATMQNCQRCVCHELGTDPKRLDCDRVSGQCHCLPNVIGERCDRCDLYFWNLTSGYGCDSCACDPQGSLSPNCNMFDGQCECKPGRGGRTCGDCENIYWGDPQDQCYPCDCNIQGSATMQCDRHTGQCICLEGISGYKCDRCDRGTTGELPNCVPCGECFDNWDRVIRDLTSQTRYIVDEAHKIKDVGASRAFDKEFQQMEENIDEIRAIIANSSISAIQVAELEELLVQIRQNLTANVAHLDDIDKDLQDSTSRVQTGTNRIVSLKFRVDDLKALAQELRKNATQVKSQEIEGAFNITREAQMRSQAAQDKIDLSEQTVALSQQTRQEVEDLIAKGEAEFNRKVQANEQDLLEIDRDVMSLNGRIVDINQMVCDGTGNPCDALCGGGGCNSCGGPSCDNGAVTKANNALDLARKAEELLKVKEGEAQSILTDISVAKRDADEAKDEAQMAYESALVAKNHSETARSDLEDLLIRIQDFLSQSGASPADIRQLAQEVLDMSISLTPYQIRTLAQQINETISGLQNIDSILNDTKDDLDLAQRLKDRADNASRNAAAILGTAEQVLQALSGAKVAQDAADQAIKQANNDITDAEGDLTMIESETVAAAETANKSLNSVTILKGSLAGLRKKYTENDLKVKQAETEAEEAARLADAAGRDASDLDSKYQSASDQLNSKFNMTSDARERANKLRERANQIAADTFSKLQRLQDMQKDYEQNEKTLVDLSQEIDDLNKRMSDYLLVIQEKAKDYRDCQPD